MRGVQYVTQEVSVGGQHGQEHRYHLEVTWLVRVAEKGRRVGQVTGGTEHPVQVEHPLRVAR